MRLTESYGFKLRHYGALRDQAARKTYRLD